MKNKKKLKILAILISITLVGIITYLFLNFQKKKEKIEALKKVPSLSLTTIGGTLFTSTNLDNNKIKILVYFSPSCHFCQAETEELSKSYPDYKNIQWIWVASESLNEIKEFAQQYNLSNQKNIIWCHDEKAILYQKLAMNSIPYFLVYDKNNNLIRRNSGAIKLNKLINTADENK
ncbi:TlpA family protein disulfide reductase [Chryseobacterium sp. PMSZPI]|uniref:TlpA family protein disulfide reductase n=1 Tax=Chryseobacterium sp. PMSZPI TaxID=1033900 RepID=UPI00161906CD|nr:redoxin domain-containing protein [Chryseobacterium sp. PMSZPI]